MDDFIISRADYVNPRHAAALVLLLDQYARDPMGGGKGLSEFAKSNVVAALAARPQAFSFLAFASDAAQSPIGLVNCMEGFSTFACKPLINIHDVVVLSQWRGYGVAKQMLESVAALARERGACKLTLEVLSGNASAKRLYSKLGFDAYALDPDAGTAQFLQKWLV